LTYFAPGHAQQMQNCVITGGINNGSIIQNCIILGPQRFTFRADIADEIIKRLPSGKPIYFASVGSDRNQQIADQYFQYLEAHGVHFAGGTRIGVMAPPPDYPINIRDRGNDIQILIDP
jgi:hypothetical protein